MAWQMMVCVGKDNGKEGGRCIDFCGQEKGRQPHNHDNTTTEATMTLPLIWQAAKSEW